MECWAVNPGYGNHQATRKLLDNFVVSQTHTDDAWRSSLHLISVSHGAFELEALSKASEGMSGRRCRVFGLWATLESPLYLGLPVSSESCTSFHTMTKSFHQPWIEHYSCPTVSSMSVIQLELERNPGYLADLDNMFL